MVHPSERIWVAYPLGTLSQNFRMHRKSRLGKKSLHQCRSNDDPNAPSSRSGLGLGGREVRRRERGGMERGRLLGRVFW